MANKYFFVHNGLTVGGLTIDAYTGNLVTTSTTSSNSTNTGALQVAGGAGIGGDVNIGGTVTGGGIRTTSTSTAPTSPTVGDIWYDLSSDVIYRYTSDGTTSYWIDITGPAVATSSTGGATFTGGTVSGATIFTNYVTVINSATSTSTGVEAIIGNGNGTFIAPNNAGVMLHVTGQVNQPGRVYIDGQGSGAYSAVIGRRYNGTTAAPTGLALNDIIFRLGSTPYTTGGFPSISTTRIDYLANETQTTSSYGTRIEFWATPNSTTSIVKGMTIDGTATTVWLTATSISTTTGALQVKGGVGIGGDLFVGGVISGILNIVGTTNNITTAVVMNSTTNAQSFGATTIGPGGSLFVPVGSQYKVTIY